jgi:hypothetical protein
VESGTVFDLGPVFDPRSLSVYSTAQEKPLRGRLLDVSWRVQ